MEKGPAPQRSRGGYLEALLTSCPFAILAIDSEGIITFANKEAAKMVERDMKELVGESIVMLYENPEAARETNRKIYANGGTIRDYESRAKTKSGKLIPVRISATHLKDSASNYMGAVGFFEPYRPWSAAESQLKLQVQDLEAKLEKWKDRTTPVFELYSGIAMVVIVGSLDVIRLDRIIGNLLNRMVGSKMQIAIIDLSEASAESEVAAPLVKAIRAIHLLGARCILAGMQIPLAQAMEQVVGDISFIKSYSSIDVALEAALSSIGYEISKKD